jgi:hypothetical protein
MHVNGYDPSTTETILGEAAHLLRNIGFAAQHAILIGGLVPGLLVLDPGPGRSPHVGTTDIDLCLSVALVEGGTAEYERIEKGLRSAGFEPFESTYAWKRSRGLGVRVEFFCPAGDTRPAGELFRPGAADQPRAKHNMGGKLSAIALSAGEAISCDVIEVQREVVLPDGAGRTTWRFRVTGLVGFLVAKTAALVGRDKPKDAYDIVWLLESWPGGPEGAATALRTSGLADRADVTDGIRRLREEFSAPDRLGPASFVRFLADPAARADDRIRLARQAVGAVGGFMSAFVGT